MKLSRGEKKLFVLCAFALAVPLGVAVVVGHIDATPTVAATPPVVPPNPNGYDGYVQAANTMKPANPPVDAVLDLKPPTDAKLRARRYSLARKDAWLAQNKAGFALFKQALRAESLAPPVYRSGPGTPSGALRQMARYKSVESNAHSMRGDANRALQSGLDVVQLSHDMQRGGGIWGYLVSASIHQKSRVTTGDTIGHLNASQAKIAARRLEKLLGKRWRLEQVLTEDKQRNRREWMKDFKDSEWREKGLFWRKVHGGPLLWQDRLRAQTVSKRQILADFDALYGQIISRARAPYGAESPQNQPLDNPFVEGYRKVLDSTRFCEVSILTADRVLLLRLALRAYQLERGAPPPNLGALVPDYLAAMPADPFGAGAPLRYKTDGETYQLWSIGPDGIDDGGRAVLWRSRKNQKSYADEREQLPGIDENSLGDYVAGENY